MLVFLNHNQIVHAHTQPCTDAHTQVLRLWGLMRDQQEMLLRYLSVCPGNDSLYTQTHTQLYSRQYVSV